MKNFEIGEVVKSVVTDNIITFFKIKDIQGLSLMDEKGKTYDIKRCFRLSKNAAINLAKVLSE